MMKPVKGEGKKQRKTMLKKHKRQCFIGMSKHQEESSKYKTQQSIFDEI